MMSRQTYLTLYKYMLIGLAVSFVASIITIFVVFNGIKTCDVEYGEIVGWGYQNISNNQFSMNKFNPIDNPNKYVEYRVNNNTVVKKINESGDLEIIKELFPVGDDYIITTCQGELEGFARRGFINDIFLYKLAKII